MTLELEKLITEIRQDYQIPPYFQDTGLMRYLEEGKARLDFLNPGQSLDDAGLQRQFGQLGGFPPQYPQLGRSACGFLPSHPGSLPGIQNPAGGGRRH